jgi:hypothetical protein
VEQEQVQEPRLFTFFDRYSWLNYEKQSNTEEKKK